jgi:succinate dehydrogenase flavin-adding protein (antitoxin of CptAB toxin-antitoxin module)
MALDQADNNTEILKEHFKEKMFQTMKENLIFSIISFLWHKTFDSESFTESEKKETQKDFIKLWKDNIINVTQEQLKLINNLLNENNIDMINIITGEKETADIEDYQSLINSLIKETEKIYWKICGEKDT